MVGGDLYGVCAAAPYRLLDFLGDVSGKGIPASMFMVRAISLARLLADLETHACKPPAEITASFFEKVRAPAGSTPQSDVIAILTLNVAST